MKIAINVFRKEQACFTDVCEIKNCKHIFQNNKDVFETIFARYFCKYLQNDRIYINVLIESKILQRIYLFFQISTNSHRKAKSFQRKKMYIAKKKITLETKRTHQKNQRIKAKTNLNKVGGYDKSFKLKLAHGKKCIVRFTYEKMIQLGNNQWR